MKNKSACLFVDCAKRDDITVAVRLKFEKLVGELSCLHVDSLVGKERPFPAKFTNFPGLTCQNCGSRIEKGLNECQMCGVKIDLFRK